jgi:hypothetical protein
VLWATHWSHSLKNLACQNMNWYCQADDQSFLIWILTNCLAGARTNQS